ncbi:MAG: hypothetical protein JST09_06035 [Bacteroidetes bacterium]|nr:hypothetical protein [Bacteroidota bacterium]
MIDQFEIFKKLREYAVEPPAEVRLRIFNSIEDDFNKSEDMIPIAQLEQLQELEIAPPLSMYSVIEQRAIPAFQLSFLKDYQVTPPVNAYHSIIERIEAEKRLKRIDGGAVVKSIYRFRAAIAILLIAGIGWFAYQLISSPFKPVIETVSNNTKASKKANDGLLNSDTNNGNENIAAAPVKKLIHKKQNVEAKSEKVSMSVGDYKFSVENNDLLATFASFDYRRLPLFISNDEEKGFSIQVDQYTAISVSQPMSKMIHKMNLYRRNGKLKAKARNTRAKLAKWQKADAEQFDKSLIKNPLDPLDLAEFIFK